MKKLEVQLFTTASFDFCCAIAALIASFNFKTKFDKLNKELELNYQKYLKAMQIKLKQEKLLISDKDTRSYLKLDIKQKKKKQITVWGEGSFWLVFLVILVL